MLTHLEETGDGGGCDEKGLGRQWPRERGSRGRSGSSRGQSCGAGADTWAGNGLVSEDHAVPRKALRGMVLGLLIIFNTRKGNFQYKISLYIIISLDYIIVYHVYHHLVSHISCPSSTHDIYIYRYIHDTNA